MWALVEATEHGTYGSRAVPRDLRLVGVVQQALGLKTHKPSNCCCPGLDWGQLGARDVGKSRLQPGVIHLWGQVSRAGRVWVVCLCRTGCIEHIEYALCVIMCVVSCHIVCVIICGIVGGFSGADGECENCECMVLHAMCC